MSETPLDKVMKFIRWLHSWKERHNEIWTDEDAYVVGIYACYVADTEKRGDVHDRQKG